MKNKFIKVLNSNVHNLKNVSVTLPKDSLIVITGPSGSGKSSLAFDTIYIEGQRRYIESLSSYARQFLGQHQPPDVESIEGLSPAIAINQKTSNKNPRSTVGTITEVYDYMRILFARTGTFYDPESGQEIIKDTPPEILRKIKKFPLKSKIHIMSSIKAKSNTEFEGQINKFLSLGFTRAYFKKKIIELDKLLELDPNKDHSFDLVIDRVLLKENINKRLIESIEHALRFGSGTLKILLENKVYTYSELNLSPETHKVYPDLEPKMFSFNSAIGACQKCNGLGESKTLSKKMLIFDSSLSIQNGAIPLLKKNSFLYKMVESILKAEKIDKNTPYKEVPESFINILFDGTEKEYQYIFESENSHFEFKKSFPGIIKWLNKKHRETSSEKTRKLIENNMHIQTCSLCKGLRLREEALSTLINKKNISELCFLSIENLYSFFSALKFTKEKKIIASKILSQITSRLSFLIDVGLHYLSLNRSAGTLSGGEGQRIRLASQIGSSLTGVLYVLDEPSIGLHQKDNEKLIQTLKDLRDIGNTVIVVEHDLETIKSADYIVDMGPKAGIHGGSVVIEGPLKEIKKKSESATGQFLTGKKTVHKSFASDRSENKFITLLGAKENNLKNVDIKIPLGKFISITGVSGSGKSSLIHKVLVPAIKKKLSRKSNQILHKRANYKAITGIEHIKTIIELDQSPIGKSPQSNPATFTGIFDLIRELYSKTSDSKVRGYKPGRFSFNIKGGRCDDCDGNGVKKIEMHFLPDVFITCSECQGTRYNKETLSILYRGKSIADILDLTIEEAFPFFTNHSKISTILKTLIGVGLGYIKLGQPATTLSGGEAQRLKLSKELAKKTKGHSLYVLDEPTTGLHFNDIQLLLEAIHKITLANNTVIIIEHNIDVIKSSEHIIDMGPGGGIDGGEVIYQGKLLGIKKIKKSLTGQYI